MHNPMYMVYKNTSILNIYVNIAFPIDRGADV